MPLGSWGHEGGHGSPLQCSCLESPMDRGAWWAAIHRHAKSRTRLSAQYRHSQDVHSSYWLFSLVGSLCVDYGPNSKQNFHCHSKYLSPFGFIFLKFSGEPNIKTPQTLESLLLLLRVLSCSFVFCFLFFLFLCRYEKDMVLPLVIFALWERI